MNKLVVVAGALLLIASCSSPTTTSSPTAAAPGPPPGDTSDGGESPKPDAAPSALNPLPGCPLDPGPPAVEVNASSATDPTGGADNFTIAMAMAGYPESSGVLTALITTDMGTIRCTLDETAAPITVANFVGLARGTRPFKPSTKWKVARFYDGLIWHRVVPDYVIQSGDPTGTGTGDPGYNLVPENRIEQSAGTIAMAGRDGAVSGSQFYVVVGKGPPPKYNVFGTCETETAVAIAGVARGAYDKPETDVHLQRIDVARCPK